MVPTTETSTPFSPPSPPTTPVTAMAFTIHPTARAPTITKFMQLQFAIWSILTTLAAAIASMSLGTLSVSSVRIRRKPCFSTTVVCYATQTVRYIAPWKLRLLSVCPTHKTYSLPPSTNSFKSLGSCYLLQSLRSETAAAGSLRKFAYGNTSGENIQTIYGLTQCTPDLSQQNCNGCLHGAFGNLCSNGKIGGRVISPSCYFLYEVYGYINISPVKPQITFLKLTKLDKADWLCLQGNSFRARINDTTQSYQLFVNNKGLIKATKTQLTSIYLSILFFSGQTFQWRNYSSKKTWYEFCPRGKRISK